MLPVRHVFSMPLGNGMLSANIVQRIPGRRCCGQSSTDGEPSSLESLTIHFQANLLGSTLGLYIAFHLERYYRHRREVSSHTVIPFSSPPSLCCRDSRFIACIARSTPNPSLRMTRKTTTLAQPNSFPSTTLPWPLRRSQRPQTALPSLKQRDCRTCGTRERSYLTLGRRATRRMRDRRTGERGRHRLLHQRSWSPTNDTVQ